MSHFVQTYFLLFVNREYEKPKINFLKTLVYSFIFPSADIESFFFYYFLLFHNVPKKKCFHIALSAGSGWCWWFSNMSLGGIFVCLTNGIFLQHSTATAVWHQLYYVYRYIHYKSLSNVLPKVPFFYHTNNKHTQRKILKM